MSYTMTNKPLDPVTYQGCELVPYQTYMDQYQTLVDGRNLYRAKLREVAQQRDELLEAANAAVAALSQTATFPADVDAARKWLSAAIARVTETAVPDDQPDPPYPHRTHVCTGCGTAVDEDDLADGNLCHICIKR